MIRQSFSECFLTCHEFRCRTSWVCRGQDTHVEVRNGRSTKSSSISVCTGPEILTVGQSPCVSWQQDYDRRGFHLSAWPLPFGNWSDVWGERILLLKPPKVSKVKNNAGPPGPKEVVRVFHIGQEPQLGKGIPTTVYINVLPTLEQWREVWWNPATWVQGLQTSLAEVGMSLTLPYREKQLDHAQALEAVNSRRGCPSACDLGAIHWKKRKRERTRVRGR